MLWTVDNLRTAGRVVNPRVRWGPVDAGDLEADEHGRALLVAMPARHLEAARAICAEAGSATLPAGGPGDLDVTPTGTLVLVIETEDEEAAPAATWRAVFEGRVHHVPGEPWPAGLPQTWTEERRVADDAAAADGGEDAVGDDPLDDDEEDEDGEEGSIGPQSFFRVRKLEPMPQSDWVFANELVPKQERRGRTFVPRTPRSIRFVD